MEDQLRQGVADGGTDASKESLRWIVVLLIFRPFFSLFSLLLFFLLFALASSLSYVPRYDSLSFERTWDQRAIRVRTNSVAAERYSGSRRSKSQGKEKKKKKKRPKRRK
jgi:hypothetical protein